MNNLLIRILIIPAILVVFSLQAFIDRTIYFGSIQFPTTLERIPGIRIWHEGKILPVELDHGLAKLSFEVAVERGRASFYLVVTDGITIEAQDNTIRYFRISPGASYKIYFIERVRLQVEGTLSYRWIVHEVHIPLVRLPDDALIVYCPAHYVQEVVASTSSLELPKIVIKPDLIEQLGSPLALYDAFIKVQLQAINFDAMHDTIVKRVKVDASPKTIIAMNIS
jgi:hypothetical protein